MKRGNCYVTSEALYHLLGGREAGWKPMTVRHEGDVHWWLENIQTGQRIDATASQFSTPPPYHEGRGRGFLTSRPSRKARKLMEALVWQQT